MIDLQIKRGSKNGLPNLLTGEFGLVTDQSDEELYIGGNSKNKRIALLSADNKLPLTELPTHKHGASDINDSGVTAGTYKSVTVNSKGIVTAGSNPTTLAGYGITNAYTKEQVDELDNSILEGLYSEIEDIVETGSGSFTNISNNASLRYLLYTYQIVGNFVTLNVKITMDASTGPLTLTSLPVTTKKTTYGSCVSSANVLCKWTISNNTIEIKKSDSTGMWSHNSGETINFIATYEI